MDSVITAAARALAVGDLLGALKRVALRDDPPALALRGIAMAQLGDLVRAKALLRSAARAFGPKEAVARARCVVAEAEIALVSRDLGWPVKALDAARVTLEAHGDRVVTARDSLEYWDNKQMAVARGNAVVVNEDKRLSGSIVTAYFTPSGSQSESRSESGGNGSGQGKKPGGQNKSQKSGGTDGGDQQQKIRRIEAFENVRVSSPGQIAVANTGVYDVESGIATLYGSVKITREDNQLNGEYGEVNLNTGVSRMLSGPPGSTGPQPVHGLFSPKKKPEMTSPSGSSSAQEPVQAPVKAPSQPAAARLVPTQAPSPAP